MKNRNIKMLTAAACLALVGSASAAWVYKGDATAEAEIGVEIAEWTSGGKIVTTNTAKLLLDKEISWKEGSSISAKHVKDDGATEIADDASNITKKYTITVPQAFNTYITTSSELTGTWTNGTEIVLPTFTWVNDYNSDNMDNGKYTTMKNALANLTITVTFTTSITSEVK